MKYVDDVAEAKEAQTKSLRSHCAGPHDAALLNKERCFVEILLRVQYEQIDLIH